MTSLQEYKRDKIRIVKKLNAISQKKIKKGQSVIVCAHIGKVLEVSGQTVYNYIRGQVNDPLFAIAIYKELQKYKIHKP